MEIWTSSTFDSSFEEAVIQSQKKVQLDRRNGASVRPKAEFQVVFYTTDYVRAGQKEGGKDSSTSAKQD